MFNVGGGELLVIALVALIVLGPQRLPEAARTVGKVVGEIRKLSSGFQREIRDAFEEVDTTTRKPAERAPLAAAVADADDAGDDGPGPLDDDPLAPDVLADAPDTDGPLDPDPDPGIGVPDSTAAGAVQGDVPAANGDAPAGIGENGTGEGARRRSGAGELAPEVGDAIDQVVAATSPGPAATDGDDRPPTELHDDGPGDARAAS
jgi:sec-independent protein translocase protein TatB